MGKEYILYLINPHKREPWKIRESQFPPEIIAIVKTAVEKLERDKWFFVKQFTIGVREDIKLSGLFEHGNRHASNMIIPADYWLNVTSHKISKILVMLGYRNRDTVHDEKRSTRSTMVRFKTTLTPPTIVPP